ncbi:MAG: hypothetical protein K1000chlam1_00698 [Candidatus Anoxychlamydiales bacterium]|nr:hypothetical protein [Candidatus Anoxychlamydiales bacterium]
MATIDPRIYMFTRANNLLSHDTSGLDYSPDTQLGEEKADLLYHRSKAREEVRLTHAPYAYLLRAQEFSASKTKDMSKEYVLALAQLFKGQELLDRFKASKSVVSLTAEFRSTSKKIQDEKAKLSRMIGCEMANSFLKIAIRERDIKEAKRLLDDGLEVVEKAKQEVEDDEVDQDSDLEKNYVDVEIGKQKYRADISSHDFLGSEIKDHLNKENSIEILELIFRHKNKLNINSIILVEPLVLADNNLEIFKLLSKYQHKIDSCHQFWSKYLQMSVHHGKRDLVRCCLKM